jgi:ABC-type uncharacterized transport system ATPase subunit
MGNRNQLAWDLPALDSFELQRAVYGIPGNEFKHTRDEFIDLLELQELIHKPVRNLSLGERMKMEIVGSLLHRPKVLFLDEPTIGLDVTMQRRIRSFITEYNRRYGATVLLTSHSLHGGCRNPMQASDCHPLRENPFFGSFAWMKWSIFSRVYTPLGAGLSAFTRIGCALA